MISSVNSGQTMDGCCISCAKFSDYDQSTNLSGSPSSLLLTLIHQSCLLDRVVEYDDFAQNQHSNEHRQSNEHLVGTVGSESFTTATTEVFRSSARDFSIVSRNPHCSNFLSVSQ